MAFLTVWWPLEESPLFQAALGTRGRRATDKVCYMSGSRDIHMNVVHVRLYIKALRTTYLDTAYSTVSSYHR
jgi:hypothetical protein